MVCHIDNFNFNFFQFLQSVSNVVTKRPKNTGKFLVMTEKYLLAPLKRGSTPQKVDFQNSRNYMLWVL